MENTIRYSKPIFLLCWNLFLKGNQIFRFFLNINLLLKKKITVFKKSFSHWVTVFKKKTCFLHWLTVFEKKWSKTIKYCKTRWSFFDRCWHLLTLFDSFFLNTVTQCDKHFFFIKHSDSVWQTCSSS